MMPQEKIINFLRENPGSRMRTIRSFTHVMDTMTYLYEMEEEGLIYCVAIHDTANMEFYNKWYVKEA